MSISSPEGQPNKAASTEGDNHEIAYNVELSEAETSALEERYNVGGRSKAAIGAIAMSAALAGGMPSESHAQPTVSSEGQVQHEKAERSIVRSGTVAHPELGALTIQVYRKSVDVNNPVFNGSMYGVLINGAEMTVTNSRFMRNGAGIVEFKNAAGDIEKLQYPSLQSAASGEKPQYTIKGGAETLTIESK